MNTTTAPSSSSSTTTMLAEAEALLREGRAEDALPIALHALDTLQQQQAPKPDTTITTPPPPTAALPILNTIAEIYLELGSAPTARAYFLRAVSLDPTGLIPSPLGGGSGADKFLQLAQLSPQGGEDSVSWYSRGAAVLRREISSLEKGGDGQENKESEEEKEEEREEEGPPSQRAKLARALCAIIEVYMTDLSWSPDAEAKCESLISEALLVAPSCSEPLQTLASIRISQARVAEARDALRESMRMWGGLGHEDDDDDNDDDDGAAVPDFATRVSLARLLMEVGMEEEALGVVERLVLEDDGSVEAWYLGGWCLYLLGVKMRGDDDGMEDVNGHENGDSKGKGKGKEEEEDLYTESMVSSREWLRQSLKLYELVEYEDERLRDHARELVKELDAIVGGRGEDEDEDEVDGGEEEEEEEEEEWDGFGEESEEEQEQEDEMMDEG